MYVKSLHVRAADGEAFDEVVSLTERRVGLPGAFEVNAPRPGSNS